MRIFLANAETVLDRGQQIRRAAFDRTGVTEYGAAEIRPDRFVCVAQGITAAPAGTVDLLELTSVLPSNREVQVANFLGVTRAEVAGKTIGQLILLLDGGTWIPKRDGMVRVSLAGVVLHERPAIQGGAVDTFTYSNGRLSTVSSGAWTDSSADMAVSTNAILWSAGSANGNAFHATELSSANHYMQFTAQVGIGDYRGYGGIVRGNGDATAGSATGYRAEFGCWNVAGIDHQVSIVRLDGGTTTEVASANVGAEDTDVRTVLVTAEGTTIEITVDSVVEATYGSASSYTTQKFVGIYAGLFGGTANQFLDDAEWGALGDAPSAPTDLVGRPGDTLVALDWTLGGDGGSAITDHDADWAEASAPTTWLGPVATGSTSPNAVVTGLSNGTAYVFRVRAVNAVGDGAWSASSAEVIPDVQSAAQLAGDPIQSAERLA